MSQTQEHRSPSLSFLDAWVKFLLCLGVTILLGFLFIQFWWPPIVAFLVSHWLLIGGVGAIVAIGGTAHKTVPAGWRAFRAISTHRDEKQRNKAYTALLAQAQVQMANGYDIELVNRLTGEELKVNNPFARGRGGVSIEEIQSLIDEKLTLPQPAAQPQIEAPRSPQDAIHLSDNYNVPADDVLSGRKLFVGVSGSGKSNTVGTYGEELGRLNVPFVLADTEDEYQPLCNQLWLPNGMIADARNVSVDNAVSFGRAVLDNNLQVILNLQSYEMPQAAMIMIGIITGMRQWQEERGNERRIPCDFILEEAVTWLPQNVKESPLHGLDELAKLQGTIFNDMVRKGRKRGLGITLVCQRIAELDKRALQSDTKLLHRQTENNDLELYEKMGISRDEAPYLSNGEAFLFTSRVSKMKVQVRLRHSPHGGNTPGLENLRRHQQSAKSAPETPRNFDEIVDADPNFRSRFDQPTEPFRNISAFPATTPKNGLERVPENIRKDIERLYKKGGKRTEIRDQLDLNGDEYWMVKAVCNHVDEQEETRRA